MKGRNDRNKLRNHEHHFNLQNFFIYLNVKPNSMRGQVISTMMKWQKQHHREKSKEKWIPTLNFI